MKPARPEDIPAATHSGIWKLGDLELRVHRLDDGTTVIEAADFKKALEWLGMTEADMAEFGFRFNNLLLEAAAMSYHDFTPTSLEGRIGKAIYLRALDDRRGFRYDQLGIHDDQIWREIFDAIGSEAIFAVKTIK